MKKFYNTLLSSLAVCTAVSLASCGSDNKEEEIIEPEPVIEYTNLYSAVVTDATFDLYDVKLILKSGSKTKEIDLKKSDCKEGKLEFHGVNYAVYRFDCDGFDGERGVTSGEGTITPKADIETRLNAMDADTEMSFIAGARVDKVELRSNGDYSDIDMSGIAVRFNPTVREMLVTNSAGKTCYEALGETLSSLLEAQ